MAGDAAEKIAAISDAALAQRKAAAENQLQNRQEWPGTMEQPGSTSVTGSTGPFSLPAIEQIKLDPDLYQHWWAAANNHHPQGWRSTDILLFQVLRNQERLHDDFNKRTDPGGGDPPGNV